jgi:Glycosyltransferase Family 4
MGRFLEKLPRLLYDGDVPVESSYHGSALLFRLLEGYPVENLQIIEGNISRPERRLPHVEYTHSPLFGERLLRTRLHRWASSWFSLTGGLRWRRVKRVIGGFVPEAVLTVTHGFSWLGAAALARERQLRLYLILHDDWPRMTQLVKPADRWLDHAFGRIYRQACVRFCVSPYMEASYRERYGVPGTVLYPSRARESPIYEAPPERLRRASSRFTAAYGGNIFSGDCWDALRNAAQSLSTLGGRLVVFSPHTREQAASHGLDGANVECRGLVPSREMIQHLREEADLLLIPESFERSVRANMSIHFPSKLTDATIPGVPLLIYGPPYCSAVRWANDNPGVGAVVQSQDQGMLDEAIRKLHSDGEYRYGLGAGALALGKQFFSHAAAERLFFSSLMSGDPQVVRF